MIGVCIDAELTLRVKQSRACQDGCERARLEARRLRGKVAPWFDVLERVFSAEPVAVTGAFNFGLKSIAKAMHAAGFISATMGSGRTDGLGAMVAAAARETATHGMPLSAHAFDRRDRPLSCRRSSTGSASTG
jgi:hypothetical protein